jgi:hypothetical protein
MSTGGNSDSFGTPTPQVRRRRRGGEESGRRRKRQNKKEKEKGEKEKEKDEKEKEKGEKEKDISWVLQGSYIENTVIVQYDALLQEVWDQARKIRCTWLVVYCHSSQQIK